jgi:hypothetical protein
MAFDQAPVGNLSAELMEALEATYGEDARIGAVVLIVEVLSEQAGSEVAYRSSDPRKHVNLGLLEVAHQNL